MGSYISYLFIDPKDLDNTPGGFIQLMFLMAAYAYFLYQGSHYISDGSELLLLVPSIAGIVGVVVLPVLGAVPDGAIVLFSGLGPDAQAQLSVGVGALAGSTVMLLTLPWALCVFAGRVDLDAEGNCVYKKPRGAGPEWAKLSVGKGWRHALFGSGIPMQRPMRLNAGILAFTALAYFLIQIPSFMVGCGKGSDCARGGDEKYWALAGFFFATLSFIAYLIYQVRVGGEEPHHQDKMAALVGDKISEGHIGVSQAFFAFMHEQRGDDEEEGEHLGVPGQHHTHQPHHGLLKGGGGSTSLLHHEAQSPAHPDSVSTGTATAGGDISVGIGAIDPAAPSEADSRRERKMRSMLRRFFRKYDRDGNGSIDLQELQLLLHDIGQKMSPDAVKGLFNSMDVSGDQSVDFEEFYAAIKLVLQQPELVGQLESKVRDSAPTPEEKQAQHDARKSKSVAHISINASPAASARNILANGSGSNNGSGRNLTPAGSPPGADALLSPMELPTATASTGASEHRKSHADESMSRAAFVGSSVSLKPLGSSEDAGDSEDESDVEEEEEEVPEDLKELTPADQQRAIKLRAAWMMSLGTALILLFSDPMVDCLSSLGDRTTVPPFYVAFLLAPLAANASELMAAVNYASKKTPGTVTISMTSLEGSATMNNTFCLLIFLMLVFAKNLVWEFSAETISILVVELVVALMTLKKVHRGIDALFILSLYPISMGLVALLENVVGLN